MNATYAIETTGLGERFGPIDALGNTMIKGQGLADSGVLLNALVLAAFAVFFVALASRTVRQQVE